MKQSLIIFFISTAIGLGGGYLFFDNQASDNIDVIDKNETVNHSEEKENIESIETTTGSKDGEILTKKGCLGCHAVSKLGLEGGATGPDLSDAFNNVEGKHGKSLTEFLKNPTSAVMTSVISGSPLSDDEISQIEKALKAAAQQ